MRSKDEQINQLTLSLEFLLTEVEEAIPEEQRTKKMLQAMAEAMDLLTRSDTIDSIGVE